MQFVIEIGASFSNRMVNLSKYLVNVVVTSDYKDKIMPMWAFNFQLPYSIKRELQEEDFSLPFRIYSIKKSGIEGNDPYFPDEEVIYDEVIYEDEIIEYTKTHSNIKQYTEDEENVDQNAIQSLPYTISGLSKNIMETNSSILNGNYRNSMSLNALKASIQDLDKKINIITSDANLVREYEQIIIPPMNLIPAIKHILTYYPIYNTYTGIFFNDPNNLHIFTNTFDSLRTRIDVEVLDNSQEIQYNPDDFILTQKEENYYTYKTNITPSFETTKKVNDVLLGIEKIIYSYDDIFNLRSGSSVDRNNIYNKKRIYWNELNDDSSISIIEDIYKRNKVTALNFLNVDPRIFNQYTYVNILGDDSISYLIDKYSVVAKTEVFSTSPNNKFIFNNELTLVVENVIE